MDRSDKAGGADPLALTSEEAELLRRVAGELVVAAANHSASSIRDYPLGRLAEFPVVGVFVTLRKHGELRGCIGNFAASVPLGQALEQAAVGVVSHDPRFPPVTPEELPDLAISVSLLHSRELLASSGRPRSAQVVIGRHGLDIQFRGRKGLLLPNVATDFGLDPISFLQAVCRKAGLPDDAWQDPEAILYRFCAVKL